MTAKLLIFGLLPSPVNGPCRRRHPQLRGVVARKGRSYTRQSGFKAATRFSISTIATESPMPFSSNRRDFLAAAFVTGAGLGLGAAPMSKLFAAESAAEPFKISV